MDEKLLRQEEGRLRVDPKLLRTIQELARGAQESAGSREMRRSPRGARSELRRWYRVKKSCSCSGRLDLSGRAAPTGTEERCALVR